MEESTLLNNFLQDIKEFRSSGILDPFALYVLLPKIRSQASRCLPIAKKYMPEDQYNNLVKYIESIKMPSGLFEIDDEDKEHVDKHKWYTKDGYQNLYHANIDNKLVSIGRYVLSLHNIDIPKNCCIYHKDGNKLNNRKSNLLVEPYKPMNS